MDTDKFLFNNQKTIVGFNQSKRLIKEGLARYVFLAYDAQGSMVDEIKTLCSSHGVELVNKYSKKEMGNICGIDVDCAVFALQKTQV